MTPVCVDERPTGVAPEICEYLDWDSRFFNIRIGRVGGNRLDPERMRRILESSQKQSLDCLYFLADGDAPTLRLAEQHGFQLVDIRVTLTTRMVGSCCPTPGASIREAVPDDIPLLREIAAASYTASRFYQDRHFSCNLCDELYRVWIEKSCKGYADAVLVAEHASRAVGYVSCHLNANGTGQIGLVGVDPAARKLGLGRTLLAHVLCWFQQRGVHEVAVVTQGSNIAAQRLYQRSGFLPKSVQLWYHFWPREQRDEGDAC